MPEFCRPRPFRTEDGKCGENDCPGDACKVDKAEIAEKNLKCKAPVGCKVVGSLSSELECVVSTCQLECEVGAQCEEKVESVECGVQTCDDLQSGYTYETVWELNSTGACCPNPCKQKAIQTCDRDRNDECFTPQMVQTCQEDTCTREVSVETDGACCPQCQTLCPVSAACGKEENQSRDVCAVSGCAVPESGCGVGDGPPVNTGEGACCPRMCEKKCTEKTKCSTQTEGCAASCDNNGIRPLDGCELQPELQWTAEGKCCPTRCLTKCVSPQVL